jgi:mannosyltransferase OCH1-like enzyme
LLIPRIAHYIWIGGNPLPDEFKYYQEKFKHLHPDWKVMHWDDDNVNPDELINKEAYLNADNIVLKADILRLELIYKYGGIFCDQDMEFYKNIDPYIEDLDCFGCGEKPGIIGNAIIGATPKHPTILKAIKGIPDSIKNNPDAPPNIQTGPVYMTKTLNFDEIYCFSPHYFFPTQPGLKTYPDQEHVFPDSIANHHWSGSWVGKVEQKQWGKWLKENPEWRKRFESPP